MGDPLMACDPGNLLCNAAGGIGDVIGAVGGAAQDAILGPIGTMMFSAYDTLLKFFMTSWLLSPSLVDFSETTVEWFRSSINVITVFLAVLGLTIAGVRTFFEGRFRPIGDVLKSFGTLVAVSLLGTAVVQLFVAGGQALTAYLLLNSASGLDKFGVQSGATAALMATGPGLPMIFGIIGIGAVFVQWIIMLLRNAVLPLLLAFWPVSAAGAMLGETGMASFKKLTTWILAFILYVPLAGGVYAFAWQMKSGAQNVGDVINGIALICLAIFTMPALLRLLVPAADAVGKAWGATVAVGVTAAAITAGVAVGAAVATGGASAGAAGAAGTAGTSGPNVATGTTPATGGTAPTGVPGADGTSGSASGGSSPSGGSSSSGPVFQAAAGAVSDTASEASSSAAEGGVIGD